MARGFNPQSRFTRLGKITSDFGVPTDQEASHGGIDIANEMGTPIPAMTDGVVTKVEGGHTQGEQNFGNQIEIKNSVGDTIQLNHLRDLNVRVGQRVKKNQNVATMGNTGATASKSGLGDGTNLDVRIISAYGQYKSPMLYLRNL